MHRKTKKINYKKTLFLRPIQLVDLPFLQTVYGSTRVDVQNNTAWTTAQKSAFIQQQFYAQHAHYQAHYKGADFDLILLKKKPIGRLYVHRQPTDIRVVDIALLPKYQNKGIGGFLLKNIMAEGKKHHKTVSLHVEKTNPALKLYERLGFKRKAEVGMRFLLEWRQ